MECFIMAYGWDLEPMTAIFFLILHDFEISCYVHVLAQCVLTEDENIATQASLAGALAELGNTTRARYTNTTLY